MLANKVSVVGKTIAVLATGGNLTYAKFKKCLTAPAAPASSTWSPPFDWTGLRCVVDTGAALQRPLLVVQVDVGCVHVV